MSALDPLRVILSTGATLESAIAAAAALERGASYAEALDLIREEPVPVDLDLELLLAAVAARELAPARR